MNRLWITGLLLSTLGCMAAENAPEPPGQAPTPGVYLSAAGVDAEGPPLYVPAPVETADVGEAALLPPPTPRTRVRLHIEQLQNSLSAVLGGMEWVTGGGTNRWLAHYTALGVPDYINNMQEVLAPALLFDKLLGDAARDLCPQLLAQEKTLPITERVFLTQVELSDTLETGPQAVEENLSLLLLRFHGRYLPAGDERLQPWKTLFGNATSVSESTETAWTAVCVALLTHPEFSSR